jgi:hypothetical protein
MSSGKNDLDHVIKAFIKIFAFIASFDLFDISHSPHATLATVCRHETSLVHIPLHEQYALENEVAVHHILTCLESFVKSEAI